MTKDNKLSIDSRLVSIAKAVESKKIDISDATGSFKKLIGHILVIRDIESSIIPRQSKSAIEKIKTITLIHARWFDNEYCTNTYSQIEHAEDIREAAYRFMDLIYEKINIRLKNNNFSEEMNSYLASAENGFVRRLRSDVGR